MIKIWVNEFRFNGQAEWTPRGDGARIDAYSRKEDAEHVVVKELRLYGHNTEYRTVAYVKASDVLLEASDKSLLEKNRSTWGEVYHWLRALAQSKDGGNG
jgi:hypothetical protein